MTNIQLSFERVHTRFIFAHYVFLVIFKYGAFGNRNGQVSSETRSKHNEDSGESVRESSGQWAVYDAAVDWTEADNNAAATGWEGGKEGDGGEWRAAVGYEDRVGWQAGQAEYNGPTMLLLGDACWAPGGGGSREFQKNTTISLETILYSHFFLRGLGELCSTIWSESRRGGEQRCLPSWGRGWGKKVAIYNTLFWGTMQGLCWVMLLFFCHLLFPIQSG